MGDWVLQPNQSYDGLVAASGGLVSSSMTPENLEPWVLTTWQAELGQAMSGNQMVRFPNSGDKHIATQTRGFVHLCLVPTNGMWNSIFSVSYRGVFSVRITRGHMDPLDGIVRMPTNYDLFEPESSDDEYVYERQLQVMNIAANDWTGDPAQRTRLTFTIPVVSKYYKPLEKPECMVVLFEYRQFLTTEWTDMVDTLRLDYRASLRTYLNPVG